MIHRGTQTSHYGQIRSPQNEQEKKWGKKSEESEGGRIISGKDSLFVCLRKVRRGGFEKELEDGSALQSEGRARRQRCRDSGQ